MERRFLLIPVLLLATPLAHAWILPHQVAYYASPGSLVKACATVFFDHNAHVALVCNGAAVGDANILAGAPAVLCYTFPAQKPLSCYWVAGNERESVHVYIDYSDIINAVLAVLLVVLVVRFTVKLVRIYM
ncbi:MAG: hypothetical protein GXN93_00950 [Candidatus Diapherotrites archaeon]|nr:hypothetical protein [Candidatus Diapherotrites archaeon]